MPKEHIVIAPEWRESLRAAGLDTVAGLYDYAGGTIIKRANSTEVRRLELSHGGKTRSLFLKKYWVTKANQHLSGMFRGALFGRGKAQSEYENLARLREWGLDAPAPVAWGGERSGGFLKRSFLLSEAVPDALPLDVFICEILPKSTPARRRELIDKLAACVRRLHGQRFEHHDLYWRNILLRGESLAHFHLIDAHKGRCWKGNDQAGRIQDLATLDAPATACFRRTERLRFFLHYLGRKELDQSGKELLRRVLAAAKPMRGRQLKRLERAGK